MMGNYRTAEAFTALYERTQLIVFRYIYALHGEPQEDVEDLWLETFFKAWRSRHHFKGSEDAALGWLLKIARHLVIDKHRRKRPTVPLGDVEPFVSQLQGASTPEQRIIQQEQYQEMARLLHALPQQQREMVILRYIVGWRVNQIAEYLQMPENTVSVTLRRVIAKLSHQQES